MDMNGETVPTDSEAMAMQSPFTFPRLAAGTELFTSTLVDIIKM